MLESVAAVRMDYNNHPLHQDRAAEKWGLKRDQRYRLAGEVGLCREIWGEHGLKKMSYAWRFKVWRHRTARYLKSWRLPKHVHVTLFPRFNRRVTELERTVMQLQGTVIRLDRDLLSRERRDA